MGGRTIASALRRVMLDKGHSETEAAVIIGVNQGQISRWLNGRTIPSGRNLSSLVNYLGVDSDELDSMVVASTNRRRARNTHTGSLEDRLTAARSELRAARARIRKLEEELRKRDEDESGSGDPGGGSGVEGVDHPVGGLDGQGDPDDRERPEPSATQS